MFYKYCILLFSIMLFACTIPGTHIPIPALWTQIIDRRINYVPNESNILNNEIVETSYRISSSVNAVYIRGPKSTIYENYADPFSFYMKITLLNRNIEKIKLNNCIIRNMNGDLNNILERPFGDISVRFGWCSNDKLSRWSSNRGSNYKVDDVMLTMDIELGKRDDGYINDISIYIDNIPIVYKIDEKLSIICDFEYYFNDEENSIVKHEIEYKRIIEELKMYHFIRNNKSDDETWHEISIEEWNKYM